MDLQLTDISSDDSFHFGGRSVLTDASKGTSVIVCPPTTSKFDGDRSKDSFAHWAARLEIESQTLKEAISKELRKPVEKKPSGLHDLKTVTEKLDRLIEIVLLWQCRCDDTYIQQKMASINAITELVLKQVMTLDPRMMFQILSDVIEQNKRVASMDSRMSEMEKSLGLMRERYTMFLDAYDMLHLGEHDYVSTQRN